MSAKGDACIVIKDVDGHKRRIILKNALCIPSYKQSIFSVQAAIENGATINFSPDSAKLCALDGTEFEIQKSGKLYYLYGPSSARNHTIKEWHSKVGGTGEDWDEGGEESAADDYMYAGVNSQQPDPMLTKRKYFKTLF